MKRIFIALVALAALLAASLLMAEDNSEVASEDSVAKISAESGEAIAADQVVVYYLHMNRRCMTCEKLETYSKEAIETGFVEQLKDSSILFKVENFEEEANEHFAKDYQLYSQSLILSRQHDGRQTEWKNLDKIWQLVSNKDEFIEYVQTEVAKFIYRQEEK